jgi:GNAT superfamily N-acetyltransferase
MSETLTVRTLAPADRAAWEPLWCGYQEFYKTGIPAATTDETWRRFHDGSEPMFALGAFVGTELVGIVHCIYHRSCWTVGNYCYLQDLFTAPAHRGRGVGRALINAVYERARAEGASRVHWLTHETNTTGMLLYDKVAERSGFVQYRKVLGGAG